jgi:hypothetical protein
MKKHFLVSTALCAYVLASDPVTIDSLFKTQNGVRGITTVSFVSSGSRNTYAIYPELMSRKLRFEIAYRSKRVNAAEPKRIKIRRIVIFVSAKIHIFFALVATTSCHHCIQIF